MPNKIYKTFIKLNKRQTPIHIAAGTPEEALIYIREKYGAVDILQSPRLVDDIRIERHGVQNHNPRPALKP